MNQEGPSKIVRGQRVTQEKVTVAHSMRSEMTPAEKVVWNKLRRNQLGGFHFRRQQIIDGFIADFYCHEAGLVVEVDGSTHDSEYDSERDAIIAARGIKILRFTNSNVIKNTKGVL
jgi:very-short-patch-repair endonuclease